MGEACLFANTSIFMVLLSRNIAEGGPCRFAAINTCRSCGLAIAIMIALGTTVWFGYSSPIQSESQRYWLALLYQAVSIIAIGFLHVQGSGKRELKPVQQDD